MSFYHPKNLLLWSFELITTCVSLSQNFKTETVEKIIPIFVIKIAKDHDRIYTSFQKWLVHVSVSLQEGTSVPSSSCPVEWGSFTLSDACRLWPSETNRPADRHWRHVCWQASVKTQPAGSYTTVPHLLKHSSSTMNGGPFSLFSSSAHVRGKRLSTAGPEFNTSPSFTSKGGGSSRTTADGNDIFCRSWTIEGSQRISPKIFLPEDKLCLCGRH